MPQVIQASSSDHFRQARRLIEQYARFLGFDLEFQGFAAELDFLDKMYAPPSGAMLLLEVDAEFVGCVGLRPLGHGAGEMKRMFIQPAFQGRGLGSALMEAFLAKARELGYKSIRLDTISPLKSAQRLYRRFGFKDIPPYCFNPRPDVIYMELTL